MVRIKKLFSCSLLLSLLAFVFSLSAMKLMEFPSDAIPLSELDMSKAIVEFSPEVVRTDGLQESVGLFHDREGFFVRTDKEDVRVKSYDTDKYLRGRNSKDMIKHAMVGKFQVSKFDTGEYSIRSHGALKGGGAVGATGGAIFGKFLVHFVGHGVIQIAALCTGPAYFVTVASLEAALLPTVIEPLSNVAAVGMGIAGGVATGPV